MLVPAKWPDVPRLPRPEMPLLRELACEVAGMRIARTIENRRRKTYAGSVGYFSFSGNLDCCITIRTILIKNNIAYIQAGGGDVADSIPAREYEETLNKAKALIKAIEIAERGIE